MQRPEGSPDPGVVAATACHTPFLEAWEALGPDAAHPVVDALRAGVGRHRELLSSLGLTDEAPTDWDARAERLLEYRRAVDTEMLDPLSDAFEARPPAAMVRDTLREAGSRCASLCASLPQEMTAPWPDGALSPEPSDALGRRMGKVLARVVSAARKAGEERSFPLKNVALRHVDRIVMPDQDELTAHALTLWAEWSRRLERAWIEWGRAALPVLIRAELPDAQEGEEQALWTAVREAGDALQAGLEALLESDPRGETTTAAQAALGSARGALEADLAVAGSFLLNPSAPPAHPEWPRVGRLAPATEEWEAGVHARLRLYLSLLSILSGATAVQRRMVWRFRDRCLAEVANLPGIAARLDELDAELARATGAQALRHRIGELDESVATELAPAKEALPRPQVVDSAVRDISDATIEALLAMIRQAPAALALHAETARAPVRRGRVESRELPLQELARQSFDALRIERIRSSTAGLIDALDVARAGIGELESVYTFARDEALRELDAEEEGAQERARDLVGGALKSIAEALRTQAASLDAAVAAAQSRLAQEICDGSGALLDRLGAGRVEAKLFAARSRMADLRAWVNDTWGPPVERVWRRVTLTLARLRRLGQRLLRRGSEMVGGASAETAASARSLRALADAGGVTEGIPLVYQRLFTLDSISDPALMAGRDSELTDAMRRWRRWHDADGVPLIVRGRQGSGISSFLNVLAAEIEHDGGSVARCTLAERIADEAGLAAILCEAVEIPLTDSMDGLAHALFDAEQSALPAAVIIDDLEHLYLRVPKGTDLIERLLTLMAESEPRIFWIGGITSSAWQLVATAEPTAVTQVDVFDLPPLSASAMRAAITIRHRRSGLAIRYAEPTTGRRLLRRRLHRMRDAEGYQHLLENDFFERLHRASGGHLGLALHQWLACADFASGDGVLMRPPERPDFSVLEALDLTQNFTLKAFLEHRSLTLEEHDRVFRLPRHESYQIFESLRNRQLLKPLVTDGDADARSEIEDGLRYEVRPLLTGAVISHLQGRNIVH